MKRYFAPMLMALVLLSGCFGRKKGTQEPEKLILNKQDLAIQDQGEAEKQSIFMQDQEEGFSFEQEDSENPFSFDQKQARQLELKPTVDESKHEDWLDRQKNDQIKYNVKSVYFNFDSTAIRPDQRKALEHDLAQVKKLTKQGYMIIIEGHSCKHTGSEPYNVMLSEKRAEVIYNHFIKNGVPKENLKIVGRGAQMCIVPEGTIEQQGPNRRVELHVLGN